MDHATTQAKRTIAIISPNYLSALYTQPEWSASFGIDPTGSDRRLVPIVVQRCELKGLLAQIVYISLYDKPEALAKEALMMGL